MSCIFFLKSVSLKGKTKNTFKKKKVRTPELTLSPGLGLRSFPAVTLFLNG